ncbi:permease-like cell division protein FtsX [Flavobacteriaceae bacterium]|nr:permease-like cell division protein FtsX [Flavobacteriaceae bacterium]MDB3967928.1 permease-like cell division protein FtsX [Flavobacteriaceae bacterium]
MAKSFQETYQKRRLLTGYFSVIVSISFVLFFVGVLGLFLLNTKNIASHFKEQIVMTIYLEDSAKDIEITQLQKKIKINSATKKVRFTPKEEAAELYARDIGEDFIEFLGYNPLLNSIDIYFNAAFVNRLSLTKIKREFEITNFVNEVVYDQPLVVLLDENIRKVTYVLLITTGLFILIALLLINSSIRLSIYSKRFIIKTMQLVGATKSFIRKPFIYIHLRLGILSSLIALSGLTILIFEINKRFPELNMMQYPFELSVVFGSVLLLGIGITGISTFFATQRYLNLKTDAIY